MTIQPLLSRLIGEVLAAAGKPVPELDGRMSLFADGLGLDSLDFATLVVRLEQETGQAPFRSGQVLSLPRSVGELDAIYGGPDGPEED